MENASFNFHSIILDLKVWQDRKDLIWHELNTDMIWYGFVEMISYFDPQCSTLHSFCMKKIA